MPDRSKDRRRAVDLLFEADQRQRAGERLAIVDLLAQRMANPSGLKPMRTNAAEIVEGVAEHLARIDELLDSYSHSWTLERMPAVDLAILRIGTWELLYNEEIPDAVAVEQAVNLASDLSTDSSPEFVNGLLGQLQRVAPALRDAGAESEQPQ